MAKRSQEEDAGVVHEKKKRKTPQRRVKTITASTGKCMLPTIAPELRNKIYELVLLHNGHIHVDKKLRVPALLQVCHHLRMDTLAMWYERNKFSFTIMHCDGGLFYRFEQLIWATSLVDNCAVDSFTTFKGKPNWDNLRDWCRTACTSGAWIPVEQSGRSKVQTVTTAALSIARDHYTAYIPWSECETTLEHFRFAVGRFDPRWLN
ncbi:hypothetical protein LTR15_007838 [Elasticomyces elasticus]|nr:hypothetical protein LTR15_007838 [Elasticomyces elasticus]